MTTETLLPFDLETAIAHPERVRHVGEDWRLRGAAFSKDCIAIEWTFGSHHRTWTVWYGDHPSSSGPIAKELCLAPPEPKKVKVRIYRTAYNNLVATTGDLQRVTDRWASDHVEIPLYPQEDA